MSTFKRSEKGYPFVYNTDSTGGVTPVVCLVDPATGLPVDPVDQATLAAINTSIGAQADAAATTDTGTFSIIAFIKRGLQNWTTLLARVPTTITPGLFPVDTLGTPAVARVQATSGTAANIVLTTTCRRLSMYATQGTWYAISGTATSSSHYIASGERLDIDVPASTTVSVLQETAAGSIRISELT